MFGIAKNRILKHFERVGRGKLQFSSELVEVAATECALGERQSDVLDDLRMCLDRLPPDQRRLLLRRHQPGTTARQLAQEIGYTDTRMSRLINSLYDSLVKCIARQQNTVPHG